MRELGADGVQIGYYDLRLSVAAAVMTVRVRRIAIWGVLPTFWAGNGSHAEDFARISGCNIPKATQDVFRSNAQMLSPRLHFTVDFGGNLSISEQPGGIDLGGVPARRIACAAICGGSVEVHQIMADELFLLAVKLFCGGHDIGPCPSQQLSATCVAQRSHVQTNLHKTRVKNSKSK